METTVIVSDHFYDVARVDPVDLGILHVTPDVDRVVLRDTTRRRWTVFDLDRGITVHPAIASLDTAPEWSPNQ